MCSRMSVIAARWRRIGWLVALLLPGVCLAPAPAASAGEWTQVTCTQPDGAPAPIDGWSGGPYGVAEADSGPIDTCAQHGGALTAYDSSAVEAPAYTGAIWTYTAPAGSTIAGGSLTVSLSTPQGQAFVATPQDAYNQANVVINCQYNEPCGADGTETATVPIASTFAGAHSCSRRRCASRRPTVGPRAPRARVAARARQSACMRPTSSCRTPRHPGDGVRGHAAELRCERDRRTDVRRAGPRRARCVSGDRGSRRQGGVSGHPGIQRRQVRELGTARAA